MRGRSVTVAGIGVGAYDGPTVGDKVGAATAISHTCDRTQMRKGMHFIENHKLPLFAIDTITKIASIQGKTTHVITTHVFLPGILAFFRALLQHQSKSAWNTKTDSTQTSRK